jgi:hypothetical protein
VAYHDVVQLVEPKRQVLRKFILQLDAAKKRLAAAQETLGQLQARLAKLKRDVAVRDLHLQRQPPPLFLSLSLSNCFWSCEAQRE